MKTSLFICVSGYLFLSNILPDTKPVTLNTPGDTILLAEYNDFKILKIHLNDSQRRQLHFRNNILYQVFDYIVDPHADETIYEDTNPVQGYRHGVELKYHLNSQLQRKRYFSQGFPVGADYTYDSLGQIIKVNYYSTTTLSFAEQRMEMYLDGILCYRDSFDENGFVSNREILNNDAYAMRGKRGFGRYLYEINNCTSCHDLYEKQLGPPLAGIGRKRGNDFVLHFIQDNVAFRKTNKMARKVFIDNGGFPMNTFRNLTQEDIYLIIDYLDECEKR